MIDLSSEHLDIVRRILKNHAVNYEAWAFGSRVSGDARKYSDLDLVIKTDQRLEQRILFGLKEAFELSDLPFRVDVLDWSRISDEFKKRILSDYMVIYSKT